MLADNHGRALLAGKSRSEVMEMFPNTHSDARIHCQQFYEKELIGRDYLWFEDSCLFISFKEGKAEYVGVKKG
mgnify:CR=1 FL=1